MQAVFFSRVAQPGIGALDVTPSNVVPAAVSDEPVHGTDSPP